MSSLSSTTQDITIQHPERWTLILRVGYSAVKFIMYCDDVENSLISRELPLNIDGGDYLKALENCIYDNPVLIQDFKTVAVSVASSHFVILPDELSDYDTMLDTLDYMYAEDDGEREQSELEGNDASVAFSMPRGVLAFLQRTFNMPKIVHHLVPLVRYSTIKSEKSSMAKMFVHICDGEVDMCVMRKGKLVMVNTFTCRNTDEMLFFILNAWQNLSLDVHNDELQLSGDKAVRDELMPQLRKYISFVMPIIFPASAMKIGQDAIKAPFDLILLSQCVL
jgi:hypothetical protein